MLHQLRISVLQREILESLSRAVDSDRHEGWLSLTGLMAGRGRHLPKSVVGMVQRRRVYERSVHGLQMQQLVEVRTVSCKDDETVTARITPEGQSYLQLRA